MYKLLSWMIISRDIDYGRMELSRDEREIILHLLDQISTIVL